MTPEETIRRISEALSDRPAIRALFLSGSHATGLADDFSDLDFVLVAPEGPSDAIAAAWRAAIEATGEIVLWWDRKPIPTLINAITADWTRTDVVILKPDQLAHHAQSTLRPVFDRDGLHGTLPAEPAQRPPDASRFLHDAQNFIRVLGLLHLAAGRKEYLNGVLGIFHLRNALVDLLIAETDAPNRGGILHLNRLITDDQKALLTALPPPVPERQAMIDTHLAYARAYLPRARARAAALGVDWPEAFEAATWAKLKDSLGLDRPY